MDMSPLTGLVTALALLLYFILTVNVGRARARFQVPAPQTTGNPDFERYLRVQHNTLEQLVFFLPLLWLFSAFINVLWGAVIGCIWIVGRIFYAWGYYQASEKRGPGFALASLSTIVLLLASLIKLGLLTIAEFS